MLCKGQRPVLILIIKPASFPQQEDDSDAESEHSIFHVFAEQQTTQNW